MDVTTVRFSNREALAKAFERYACDPRVELCAADPTRLILRFALGLAPVLATSDRRAPRARSRPSADPRSPAARPRSSTWR